MNQNGINSCPGSEILEEYRDGTASDEWTLHIDKCEDCQRRIASLDLLDMRIRKVCLPPDGMAARIKAAVHEGREPSIRAVPFWRRPGFRATAASAIVLLLLSVSLYFGLDSGMRGNDGGSMTATNEIKPKDAGILGNEAAEPQLMAAKTKTEVPIQEEKRPFASSALAFDSNVRLAGTLAENSAEKRILQVAKQPLDAAVRHLWSVENPKDALEFIRKIAKANGKDVEIEGAAGGFNASIELKDTELQQLVDMLNENGWRLLSPYVPQPGEAGAIEFRNNPVIYYINVMEKGN